MAEGFSAVQHYYHSNKCSHLEWVEGKISRGGGGWEG